MSSLQELLCSSVSDLLMLLQCQILVLNDAKVSHNELHAFGSEPCRLLQLALHAEFYSEFTVTLMRAGLPYIKMFFFC